MKRYLYATLPDGKLVRRKTDKDYRFVIAAQCSENTGLNWYAMAWSTCQKFAERRRREEARFPGRVQVVLVPTREA